MSMPVDGSPFVVTELEKLPVRMTPPLELVPVLDEESQQYLCVADSDLGLDAFALTRDHLFDDVQEQLCMLWREYALAPDEELDGAAIRLKARLHARMVECIRERP
jgi:predicted ATPase